MLVRPRLTAPLPRTAEFVLAVCSRDASSPVAPPDDDALAAAKGSAGLVGTVIVRTAATTTLSPNTDAVTAVSGVLDLTLGTDGHAFGCLPIAGHTYQDTGRGRCH